MSRIALPNPLPRLRAVGRRSLALAGLGARGLAVGTWRARTLLVLSAGIGCVAAGAAWVFPPAGLLVGGALLLVVGWPEKPTPPGGEQ